MNNNKEDIVKLIGLVILGLIFCAILSCCEKKDNRSDKDSRPKETVRVWVVDHYIDFDKIR